MKRTFIFSVIVGLLAMTCVSATSSVASASALPVQPAFATPWLPGADPGPVTDETLKFKLDEKGMSYAALANEFNGAVWMVRQFDAIGATNVAVNFQIKDIYGCELAQPVIYIGVRPPVAMSQFQPVGKGMGKGWAIFQYEAPIQSKVDSVYVAIGYTTPGKQNIGVPVAGISDITVKIAR